MRGKMQTSNRKVPEIGGEMSLSTYEKKFYSKWGGGEDNGI